MIQLTSSTQRVLIVADAAQQRASCIAPLRDLGCRVEVADRLDDAVRVAAKLKPTIVLVGDSTAAVNHNLLELSMRIRSAVPAEEPPLFIMAPSCETVCCGTADASAPSEDSIPALIHRITELMRRDGGALEAGACGATTTDAAAEKVACNGVRLDRVRHRAWIDSRELRLTPTEFRLLWELVSCPGYVLSRNELTRLCKGDSQKIQSRIIDAHIKSIRRKLQDRSELIETVHGVGYRFRDCEW